MATANNLNATGFQGWRMLRDDLNRIEDDQRTATQEGHRGKGKRHAV
jgi:hypothetical protein